MYCACTVHVLCMYCACTVHVLGMYCACTGHVLCMYCACTVLLTVYSVHDFLYTVLGCSMKSGQESQCHAAAGHYAATPQGTVQPYTCKHWDVKWSSVET